MGLSIVRRYAKLLGIGLRMTSKMDRGTHFTLVVPETLVARPAERDRPGSKLNDVRSKLAGQTVLIIDDDPQIVDGMKRELTDRGCRPLTFASIAEARAALLAGRQFDVAVVDFHLGDDQTGPALLEAIEGVRGGPVPALILTGGTDAVTLAAVLATGRPWLTKPAEPDDVANALERLIGTGTTA